MPPVYGATFSFAGFSALVTGIQVQEPVAEVVDMTPITFDKKFNWVVPTGHVTGGSITIDFLYKRAQDFALEGSAAGFNQGLTGGAPLDTPDLLIGRTGQLVFSSSALAVSRRVLLESATIEARTEQLVTGQLVFQITDYAGS